MCYMNTGSSQSFVFEQHHFFFLTDTKINPSKFLRKHSSTNELLKVVRRLSASELLHKEKEILHNEKW